MADYTEAAVQAIQDGVRAETIAIGDLEYLTREVFLPPKERLVDPLLIRSLQGLADYLSEDFDEVDEKAMIHITCPSQILLVGRVEGRSNQRPIYVDCSCRPVIPHGFWGQFMAVDKFVIILQCLFEDSGDRAKVLQLVGNIGSEVVSTSSDDGVTQSVQVRQGIRRVGDTEIVNPVMLTPRRTFTEIEQVASPFILRLERKSGDLPSVALFECDGGQWQSEAVDRIKQWLRPLTNLPIIG